jgi:hypothetical protein
MTLIDELRQLPLGFHPLSTNSKGLAILQQRLRDLKQLKITSQQEYSNLMEETLKSSRDLLSGNPVGLAMDIFWCDACAAKFCTFYAAALGISADRDFISEVLESKETAT